MRVHFSHIITGAKSDFVWDSGSLVVGDESPADWTFSPIENRKGSVLAASEAAGLNLISIPSAPQAKFWLKHAQHPAWHRILPRELFGKHLREQVESVIDFLTNESNRYFVETFQTQQSLLDSLVRSKASDGSLLDYGFNPDSEGFVDVPTYDNAHSSTGRMSIKSGPKILTLPRELRKHVASRWADGEIIEIDFNGLEARVLGWISGNEMDESDAYTWIAKKTGFNNTPRSVIKEATLSAIYGMSKKNFALRYQDTPDAVEVYESIRKLMGVRELDARLQSMSRFENAFGRPLSDTNAKISHHVQSSAVDVACSGFNWLVKKLDPAASLPIFLIHDAIVLDVRRHALPQIEDLCKNGLQVDIVGKNFPVKIKRFGNE